MQKIKQLKEREGAIFYPKTVGEAVILNNGNSLEEELNNKQDLLISGTNIKTINNVSILGSGNISLSNSESGTNPTKLSDLEDDSMHRTVTDAEKTTGDNKQDVISDLSEIRNNATSGASKVSNVQSDGNAINGDAVILNKPSIPTETTVATGGFTKNNGTVTEISLNGNTYNPINGVVDLGNISSGGITTETDPTVPAGAKAASKPTYTASEVGALPNTTTIPTNLSDLNNDIGLLTRLPLIESSTIPTGGFEPNKIYFVGPMTSDFTITLNASGINENYINKGEIYIFINASVAPQVVGGNPFSDSNGRIGTTDNNTATSLDTLEKIEVTGKSIIGIHGTNKNVEVNVKTHSYSTNGRYRSYGVMFSSPMEIVKGERLTKDAIFTINK